MHTSHIMTQREIIRNNLNKSDWEITKDKCHSTRAHRRHLAANGKHENKRKIYCTNVHLRIIEILITLMYNLSAVTAAVAVIAPLGSALCSEAARSWMDFEYYATHLRGAQETRHEKVSVASRNLATATYAGML